MPNSIVSSSSFNRSHITDLSISIISDKNNNNNRARPQSASSSRRGSLSNNNKQQQQHLIEDDLHSLRSFQKVQTNNQNRPPSVQRQREAEKENNQYHLINTSAYKLDEDNISEPVSWRDDAVSIRSYNNSPSHNHSKNSQQQRPQSSFVYTIAKRAPIIPRPGSAPLTKKGRLDTSHRSKTPSELYDETFYDMQRRDESNAAITNQWHQTLDEHHERPLITTVLHEYRDDTSSRCSSRMSDRKDFVQMNKHAIAEKARIAKRNAITSRPHSYVLDNSIEANVNDFSTSVHLEGEEKRKTHTSLMKKYSTRQSVPRTVNSRTIFNPSTLAYDNSSPIRNRPKSALSKVVYKETTRHQDVVSVMSETLRPRSAMSSYSAKESFKRPTSEEPYKKTNNFLNVQGFSINQAKVVHEGHYEMPKKAKRGAPRPEPQPHTIALCVHNSRFSIENQ